MGLETGTYISDLNPNNPVNATDGVGEGDDHLRLIKALLLNTFPNITGAVNASHAELNQLVGATENVQDALDTLDSDKADAAATASALALKANDADVVKLAGAQEVTGSKTFSAAQQFSTIELGHASDTTLSRVAAGRVAVEGAELARLSVSQAFTAAQQFTTIELGHASDTTLARIAAGRVSIEGGEIAKLNASQPFTAEQRIERTSAELLRIWRTNATANQGMWGLQADGGGTFILRALTDDAAAGQDAIYALRSGANVTAVRLLANGTQQIQTQNHGAAPATTGAQVRHADGILYDVGMNVMPFIVVDESRTLARADVGKTILHSSGSPHTYSIPASSDTTIPLGAAMVIINSGAGAVTIEQASGTSLNRLNGTGGAGTGNRVLSQGGVATLVRSSSGSWWLWGNAGLN